MANTQYRKTYSIIQGGGRVYINPHTLAPPMLPAHFQLDDSEEKQAQLMGNLSNPPTAERSHNVPIAVEWGSTRFPHDYNTGRDFYHTVGVANADFVVPALFSSASADHLAMWIGVDDVTEITAIMHGTDSLFGAGAAQFSFVATDDSTYARDVRNGVVGYVIVTNGDARAELIGETLRVTVADHTPPNTWRDAGYLDDQGVSLTIGNEMEVLTEIESLWPIDARKVSAGAMFRAMMLEATLDNLYELGLSKVGVGLDSNQDTAGPDNIDLFSGDRFGGPDQHIGGVSLVFDGPAPKASTSIKRVRRVWLPRIINLTPIDLVASKRGQTMIRLDLTCLLPDHSLIRPCYIADQYVG